jgi:Tfp pilus assembly protein PilO
MTEFPSWQIIAVALGTLIMFLLGIIISLVAGYTRGLGERLTKVEAETKHLNDMVLGRYLDKDETNKLLNDVKQLVISLQGRFDMLLMQQAHTPPKE